MRSDFLKKIVLLSSLLIQWSILSQEVVICPEKITPEDIQQVELFVNNANLNRSASNQPSTLYFLLNNVIIRRTNGTGGVSESDIDNHIDELNSYFLNANIQFISCGYEYIDNDGLYDFEQNEEKYILRSGKMKNNMINVFHCNDLKGSDGEGAGGYAYFPWTSKPDFIFISRASSLLGPITYIHEIGHFFGLFHTHGKFNSEGTTDELVKNGSNCDHSGDYICDTPADPRLNRLDVNISRVQDSPPCEYSSTLVDLNGDSYSPNTRNIMSYSLAECRNFLSQGQFDRAYSMALGQGKLNKLIVPLVNLKHTTFQNNISNNKMEGVSLSRGNTFYSKTLEASNKIINNSDVGYLTLESTRLLPGFRAQEASRVRIGLGIDCEKILDFFSNNNGVFSFKGLNSTTSIDNLDKKEYKDIDPIKTKTLLVYPNPSNGSFDIEIPKNEGKLNLYNIYGTKVYEENLNSSNKINLPDSIISGMYLLVFETKTQKYQRKIIIQ